MKVRFTVTARHDLAATFDFFREHAPHVVPDFADDIDSATSELGDFPYSAPESEVRGIRRKYMRRFRFMLFYTVDLESDEVVVVYVRHARRRRPWEDADDPGTP